MMLLTLSLHFLTPPSKSRHNGEGVARSHGNRAKEPGGPHRRSHLPVCTSPRVLQEAGWAHADTHVGRLRLSNACVLRPGNYRSSSSDQLHWEITSIDTLESSLSVWSSQPSIIRFTGFPHALPSRSPRFYSLKHRAQTYSTFSVNELIFLLYTNRSSLSYFSRFLTFIPFMLHHLVSSIVGCKRLESCLVSLYFVSKTINPFCNV